MVHNQTTKFRNSAAQFFLGNVALASVTPAFRRPPRHPRPRTKETAYTHSPSRGAEAPAGRLLANGGARGRRGDPLGGSYTWSVLFWAWCGGDGWAFFLRSMVRGLRPAGVGDTPRP